MPLQRSDRLPSDSPSQHPTLIRSVPSIVWLFSAWQTVSAGHYSVSVSTTRCLPSSAGCANWPTIDTCTKVESDYNWNLRINYTQWNSDNVITQLTVTAVLDHLAMWSMIVKNPTINLDHDRDIFGEKIRTFVTQCHMRVHTHVSAHTPAYH